MNINTKCDVWVMVMQGDVIIRLATFAKHILEAYITGWLEKNILIH